MKAVPRRIISFRLAAMAMAILFVPSFGACTNAPDPPDQLSPTARPSTGPAFVSVLEKYSEDMRDAGAPAVLIQMKSRVGEWSTAVGVRSLTNQEPVHLADQVHVGALTTSMVAVSVLKLVEEGRVRLDEPITRYVPELENLIHPPPSVTVRSLLSHRSGMPSYWEGDVAPSLRDGLAKRFSHEDRLAIAAASPWNSKGSTGTFIYSESDYSALALLVEKLRGRNLGEVLQTDIMEPLGLRDTLMMGEQTAPQKMIHGYILEKDERIDTTLSAFNIGSADTGMISSIPDINAFFAALTQGKLLKPRTFTEMQSPNQDYGLGLMKRYDPCSNNYYYGHSGVTLGYGTLALTSADGSRQIAIAVSRPLSPELVGYDDGPAFQMMQVALEALNKAC
ncbi:serine hydrolase domain-containing protein [Paenarthrobacter aromaticivorans]|uniref:Beta-lactamase family protein n=1 Tax=Paenarthrobacter aromaticivorans TaxID=2849150 RepID=A0ABS6I4E2_9MICC|nr:serine hydrolase domain-containing protein [Paenarthrobacter sp. MMS21-TAE1-1]MBU8866606.1 beta-lactamase family protein [Paenarthrobacter sp. MMS21-TAE1-1]